ncbi:hypothetical protein BZA05DRAFT_416223 [Tricharina praecox]|uniref:uncharacterized protein n=1 Tax=Tricharina praecox TaxID=43433 RepID=UPI00221E399E|nr:uncharacterized protein BZA05DRAFT_416223 [Tricharina praecox]KAI5856569.1 hypothetical protein BZA05DRAFT_416223 [Tricharina praecox]
MLFWMFLPSFPRLSSLPLRPLSPFPTILCDHYYHLLSSINLMGVSRQSHPAVPAEDRYRGVPAPHTSLSDQPVLDNEVFAEAKPDEQKVRDDDRDPEDDTRENTVAARVAVGHPRDDQLGPSGFRWPRYFIGAADEESTDYSEVNDEDVVHLFTETGPAGMVTYHVTYKTMGWETRCTTKTLLRKYKKEAREAVKNANKSKVGAGDKCQIIASDKETDYDEAAESFGSDSEIDETPKRTGKVYSTEVDPDFRARYKHLDFEHLDEVSGMPRLPSRSMRSRSRARRARERGDNHGSDSWGVQRLLGQHELQSDDTNALP